MSPVCARRPAGAAARDRIGPAAAVLLVPVLLLGACQPEDNPPVASEVLREGVDMAMTQMRTWVTREGVRRARLEADTAEFMGETEIHMRPVSLTFFDPEGREMSVVTADFGIFYEQTEDMHAEGSIVVLDRRDDQRLETERLRYVSAEDRLYGDVDFVLYSDGGETELRGRSFESDPGLDSVRVVTPSGQTERGVEPGAGAEPPPAATDTVGPEAASDTAPSAPGASPDSAGEAGPDTVPPAPGADPDTAGTAREDTLPASSAAAPPASLRRRGAFR